MAARQQSKLVPIDRGGQGGGDMGGDRWSLVSGWAERDEIAVGSADTPSGDHHYGGD